MDRAASDWFEDEAFWADTYSFMFPDSSYQSAIEQVGKLVDLAGIDEGNLLDLGCGPGRFAVPFAKRGFVVTGVDITPFLIAKARTYAESEGVDIELVHQDMRYFLRPVTFDLAISMLTSFGYFDEESENLAVLQNVFSSLKSGGVFVFDTYGKEIIARVFEGTFSQELPDGGMIVQRRQVVNDWSQMENEWLLIREGAVRSFRLRHWIYSGREFKQLLTAAGFSDIRFCGDLDGKPYGPDAARMIAVARKV